MRLDEVIFILKGKQAWLTTCRTILNCVCVPTVLFRRLDPSTFREDRNCGLASPRTLVPVQATAASQLRCTGDRVTGFMHFCCWNWPLATSLHLHLRPGTRGYLPQSLLCVWVALWQQGSMWYHCMKCSGMGVPCLAPVGVPPDARVEKQQWQWLKCFLLVTKVQIDIAENMEYNITIAMINTL